MVASRFEQYCRRTLDTDRAEQAYDIGEVFPVNLSVGSNIQQKQIGSDQLDMFGLQVTSNATPETENAEYNKPQNFT